MRLALAQLNPVVGDVVGNMRAIHDAYRTAVDAGADLVTTGELALTGYPPEDLVLKPAFLTAVAAQLRQLAANVGAVPLVVGFVERADEATLRDDTVMSEGEADTALRLANAAAVLRDGEVEAVYRKQRIPNYGVFDEARYFQAGVEPCVVSIGDRTVGVTVCEDLWGEGGPVTEAAAAGAEVVLSLNASPYHRGKWRERERWSAHHATANGIWLAYCNLVGGQDEVVFDGDSFVVSPQGETVARAQQFATDLLLVDALADGHPQVAPRSERLSPVAEVYEAQVLATRDYLTKNGFREVLVGVSGGVDSALTAAVAVDAVGPDAVTAVAMPSPYSSPESLTDAKSLVESLRCRWLQLPIEEPMAAFRAALAEPFSGTKPGVAEENLQARIRGTLLMALSNKFGGLVLTTGNKSEYAVGYATLYGDMVGGFAPLKDVYKTLVYELCAYRNSSHRSAWLGPAPPVIPRASIDKAPSAELRPGQRDTDSLPPYETLDPILKAYVEGDQSVESIVAAGHEADVVREVARLVDRAEYKRRQAAPGVKITTKAFGRERRLPITQRWWG